MVETETYTIHRTAFIYQPVATPHQAFLPIGSEVPIEQKIQLSNFGMIAPGNHNLERFAALCNTPGGSQGAVAGAGSIQRSALFHPPAGGYEHPLRWAYAKPGVHTIQRSAPPQLRVRSAAPPEVEPRGTSCKRAVNVKYEQKMTFFRQIAPGRIC